MKPIADSREPVEGTSCPAGRITSRPRPLSSQLPAVGYRLLAVGLLLLSPAPALSQAAQIGVARGAVVQPVTVQDLDGQPVDLGQFIGRKPVLVEFWASWCGNCTALEPRLRAAYQRHGGRVEFLVVAVGVNQTRNSVRRHVAGHALPGRVLWDGDGAAVRAFQAPATSYLVVLDAQGRVAYTGIGPDQDVEAALARVAR